MRAKHDKKSKLGIARPTKMENAVYVNNHKNESK